MWGRPGDCSGGLAGNKKAALRPLFIFGVTSKGFTP